MFVTWTTWSCGVTNDPTSYADIAQSMASAVNEVRSMAKKTTNLSFVVLEWPRGHALLYKENHITSYHHIRDIQWYLDS